MRTCTLDVMYNVYCQVYEEEEEEADEFFSAMNVTTHRILHFSNCELMSLPVSYVAFQQPNCMQHNCPSNSTFDNNGMSLLQNANEVVLH